MCLLLLLIIVALQPNALHLDAGFRVSPKRNFQTIPARQMVRVEEQEMANKLYNLPHKTSQVFDEFDPDKKWQNMGLLLDKYMPRNVFESGKKGEWLSRIDRK